MTIRIHGINGEQDQQLKYISLVYHLCALIMISFSPILLRKKGYIHLFIRRATPSQFGWHIRMLFHLFTSIGWVGKIRPWMMFNKFWLFLFFLSRMELISSDDERNLFFSFHPIQLARVIPTWWTVGVGYVHKRSWRTKTKPPPVF